MNEISVQESICNKLAEPQATILIQGEALIIHPHVLSHFIDFFRFCNKVSAAVRNIWACVGKG